jgi:nitrite reductase/ring-hydroxylating ferredoxin subunit
LTYVKLCSTDSLFDGQLKQCNKKGIEILIIKLGGKIFCFSARCTHAGAPLIYGEVKNGVLICPWHGSQFKLDNGEVLFGPADKPLKIYPNRIEDGYIFVEL